MRAVKCSPKSEPISPGFFSFLWESGLKKEFAMEMNRYKTNSSLSDIYLERANEANLKTEYREQFFLNAGKENRVSERRP